VLAEYVQGWSLGIDELLLADHAGHLVGRHYARHLRSALASNAAIVRGVRGDGFVPPPHDPRVLRSRSGV